MGRNRRPAWGKALLSWLIAWAVALAAGLLPPVQQRAAGVPDASQVGAYLPNVREAAAAGNPSSDPSMPPPLDWPAEEPILPSNGVGYLPGSGTITSTGEYAYQIPIEVPPGRRGVAPALSLVYNSRGGNGLLGVGWALSGASEISRCSRTIAQDGVTDGSDMNGGDALCMDGKRLVLLDGVVMHDGAEYRTIEDSFARVVFHQPDAGAAQWFEVFTKEGTVRRYEPVFARRVASGEAEAGFVAPAFVLVSVRDRNGNAALFHYDTEAQAEAPYGYDYRLASIEYTARLDSDGNTVGGVKLPRAMTTSNRHQTFRTRIFTDHSTSLTTLGVRIRNDHETYTGEGD